MFNGLPLRNIRSPFVSILRKAARVATVSVWLAPPDPEETRSISTSYRLGESGDHLRGEGTGTSSRAIPSWICWSCVRAVLACGSKMQEFHFEELRSR